MNKLFFAIVLVAAMTKIAFGNEKAEQIQNFLKDAVSVSVEEINSAEPIALLAGVLTEKASETIDLTKTNSAESLAKVASYKSAVIVVGRHTVVVITDANDLRMSGAWGAKMPKGKALIQKSGALNEKEDYINNLIGIPDNQDRKLFLFQ